MPTARCSTCTAWRCWPSSCFPATAKLAVLWRDKQIEYTRLVSMSGQYRPFWDLTRAGLRFAAERLGWRWSGGTERLMNQYRHLSAFPRTARCCMR